MMRQQVPVSCSSVPVFRQASSDLRPLGSPQSPAADGGFGVTKDVAGGPPPTSQVFRRFSGNGGVTSPRPAAGGPATAGNVGTSGGATAQLSAGTRIGGSS